MVLSPLRDTGPCKKDGPKDVFIAGVFWISSLQQGLEILADSEGHLIVLFVDHDNKMYTPEI